MSTNTEQHIYIPLEESSNDSTTKPVVTFGANTIIYTSDSDSDSDDTDDNNERECCGFLKKCFN